MNDDLLAELRAIRAAVERMETKLIADTLAAELAGPVWQCGHRHSTRGEAIRCKANGG